MSNKFVKVYNAWFDIIDIEFKEKDSGVLLKKSNLITAVGTDGFALWFYIKKIQGINDTAPIQIKSIMRDLQCRGFKKVDTVKKLLFKLKNFNLIECDSLNEKTMANELLYCKTNDFSRELEPNAGFSKIGYLLFEDYINQWGHIAFTIYCYLYKLHNFKNGAYGGEGFAYPSQEHLANVLGLRCRQTVENNVGKIGKNMLKIEDQDPIETEDSFGNKQYIYLPKHYIVKAKLPGNKYNIPDVVKDEKSA